MRPFSLICLLGDRNTTGLYIFRQSEELGAWGVLSKCLIILKYSIGFVHFFHCPILPPYFWNNDQKISIWKTG